MTENVTGNLYVWWKNHETSRFSCYSIDLPLKQSIDTYKPLRRDIFRSVDANCDDPSGRKIPGAALVKFDGFPPEVCGRGRVKPRGRGPGAEVFQLSAQQWQQHSHYSGGELVVS